jgi:hypothetical protein
VIMTMLSNEEKAEIQRFKDQVIDAMNESKDETVILRPGEVWTPRAVTETKTEPPACNVHIWHKVTLFRTTVEECKKCGKLREGAKV